MDAMLFSDANPDDIDALNALVTAIGKVSIMAHNYYTFLSQKSRIKRIKEGSLNTDFSMLLRK